MPCSTAVKLPPATTWPSVGLLCLCSCTVPYFVGMDLVTDSSSQDNQDTPAVTESSSTGVVVTGGPSEEAGAAASTADAPDLPEDSDTTAGSVTTIVYDLGGEDLEDACGDPQDDCDADSDAVDHALGLNCAGGMASLAALAVAGPPESLKVVGQLGATDTFAPQLGSRAVLLSTGVADHVELSQPELYMMPECSQIGLPCPSTDFDAAYDLTELPGPMLTDPITCPAGQPPPGPGDCSQTIDAQWNEMPRVAHDYSELRLSAEVPAGSLGVQLRAAFFSAERPSRLPVGVVNDFFIVWLESEQWTGNIAIHPVQLRPMSVAELEYDHKGFDPALAGFAFEEHVATDWVTLSAPVEAGETITLVMALFDARDGGVDTAVLLDDLRWTCAAPNLGARHP